MNRSLVSVFLLLFIGTSTQGTAAATNDCLAADGQTLYPNGAVVGNVFCENGTWRYTSRPHASEDEKYSSYWLSDLCGAIGSITLNRSFEINHGTTRVYFIDGKIYQKRPIYSTRSYCVVEFRGIPDGGARINSNGLPVNLDVSCTETTTGVYPSYVDNRIMSWLTIKGTKHLKLIECADSRDTGGPTHNTFKRHFGSYFTINLKPENMIDP